MSNTQASTDVYLRQRLAQLQTVLDHGIALMSAQDLTAAFGSVLRQARMVLGADLSYLSLNDKDAGTTSIRAVDGVLTQQFRRISMPLGTGLLGQVAESDHPMQTRDYLADGALVPYPENDPKVGGEHVHAILGVPIRTAETTVGVLLVADRYVHEFSAFQVDLLQSLAGQIAGFLLANDVLNQERDAARGLGRRVSELDASLREARLDSSIDRHIARTLLTGSKIADFAGALEPLFGQRVDVIGMDTGQPPALAAAAEVELLRQLSAEAASVTRVAHPELEGGSGTIQQIFEDGDVIGALVVHGEFEAWKGSALASAAEALGGLTVRERQAAEQITRDVRELIDYLTRDGHSIDRMSARARLHHFGVDASTPLHVAVIRAGAVSTSRVLTAARRTLDQGVLLAEHGDHVCALIPHSAPVVPESISEALHELGIDTAVGMSGPEPLPDRLPIHHQMASAISDGLANLGRVPCGATRASFGVLGALIGSEPSALVTLAIEEAIGPLLTYDKERGTALVDTLEAFLDNGQQLQITADTLHLHVNTLRQRLGRVDVILGDTWRTPQGSFDMSATLKARRITQGPGSVH